MFFNNRDELHQKEEKRLHSFGMICLSWVPAFVHAVRGNLKIQLHSFGMSISTGLLRSARNDVSGEEGKKKAAMASLSTQVVIATASVAKWEATQDK